MCYVKCLADAVRCKRITLISLLIFISAFFVACSDDSVVQNRANPIQDDVLVEEPVNDGGEILIPDAVNPAESVSSLAFIDSLNLFNPCTNKKNGVLIQDLSMGVDYLCTVDAMGNFAWVAWTNALNPVDERPELSSAMDVVTESSSSENIEVSSSSLIEVMSSSEEYIAKYWTGSFVDSRDKQTYQTVTIGTQTWMAQNLNYASKTMSTFCYAKDQSNCSKFGRLYLQNILKMESSVVCPSNWHLPSKEEFQKLIKTVGGEKEAGLVLKARNTWNEGNGTNEYGFLAKASGYLYDGSSYKGKGDETMFWSNDLMSYLHLTNGDSATLENTDGSLRVTSSAFSIRCVLGPEPVLSSSSTSAQSSSSKINPRTVVVSEMTVGDSTYRTTTIGNQTWMAENMNNEVSGSECFDEDPYYCKKYGRLYTYEAAKQVCNTSSRKCEDKGGEWVCATANWRLPTMEDWKTLIAAVGGVDSVPEMLRASNLSKGDPYSFSILFAGEGELIKDDVPWTWKFNSTSGGKSTVMWAEKSSSDCTCTFEMDAISGWKNRCICRNDFAAEPYNDASLYDKYYVNKYPAYSVRCVKDAE